MQETKGEGESFREYFRRARHDAGVRREIMRSAGVSRSVAGWLAVAFAVLTFSQTLVHGLRGGGWISTQSVATAIMFVLCMMVYAKFGDRIAALQAMDEPQEPGS
jgi:uncharacterized membrane protein